MANKVRGYRNMLGITQKELADKLGLTAQSISAKERGITNFTDKEKMELLKLFKTVDPDLSIDKLFLVLKVNKSYQLIS